MNDLEDFLSIVAVVVVAIAGMSFLIVCGTKFVNITFIDNVPVVVKVDGKTVYEGISAGVEVRSSGANTTIAVRGGFLYFFPKAYYVSNDVELIGVKKGS